MPPIAEHQTSARDDLLAIARDGRFAVSDRLGAGAVGVVYRARDAVHRHDVALKLLTNLHPDSLYRFKREFRSLTDLVHPNLVTIYELHHVGTTWAVAMELVDGARSLLDYVRPYKHLLDDTPSLSGSSAPTLRSAPEAMVEPDLATMTVSPPSNDEMTAATLASNPSAATLMARAAGQQRRDAVARAALVAHRLRPAFSQMVDGIDALHRAGMLHRDIKPSNVLVDAVGRVVVCDFGLVVPDASHEEGRFAGTPAYSSPEQTHGTALGPSSDWYSVGVMLYEALTGVLPVQGANAEEVLRSKALGDIVPVVERAPDADPELAALAMELLTTEPEARPDAAAIRERLGGASRASDAPSLRSAGAAEFVGRQAERDVLQQAMDDARAGSAVTVIVEGASGVGKSALIGHVTGTWQRDAGALVLSGRCYENELVAFKALDEVVDSIAELLVAMPDEEVEALLDDTVPALAVLFPVLRRVRAINGMVHGRIFDEHRARGDAAQALRHLLSGLARRQPTVVIIDDLQWGDMDSAAFLRELADSDDSPGFVLLATYRNDGAETPPLIAALRDEISASGHARDVRTLELSPLPDADALELVRAIAGDGVDADAILRDAGGSPLFVAELAHARAQGDTELAAGGLDELIARRIADLDDDARALLEIAALAGRPRPVSLLADAARVRDQAGALATLRSGRFVRIARGREGEQLTTYHDRIRETATSGLDPSSTRSLHRRLARAFEAAPDKDVEALVEHWRGAGHDARAGKYALKAAEKALRAQAHRRAADHLAVAIELSDATDAQRLAMAIARADALMVAGSVAEAAVAFQTAAGMTDGDEAGALRGRALVCMLRAGKMLDAADFAGRMLADIGLNVPATMGAALRQIVGERARLLWQSRREPTILHERNHEPRTLARLDVYRDVSTALAFTRTIPGFAVHSRYLREARECGEPRRLIHAVCVEATFHSALSGKKAALKASRLLDIAADLARTHGSTALEHLVAGWRTFSFFFRYRDSSAVGFRLLQAADNADADPELAWQADIFRQYAVTGLALGGQLGELTTMLPAMLRRAQERGNQYLVTNIGRQAGAFMWLAADQPEHAERLVSIHEPELTDEPTVDDFFFAVIKAEIAAYRGDPVAASDRVMAFADRMRGTSVAKVPGTVAYVVQAGARASIGAARLHPDRRDEYLGRVRRFRNLLRRGRRAIPEYTSGICHYIDGLVAGLEGDADAMRRHMKACLMPLDGPGALFTMPMRFVLAELTGGAEGDDLRARAEAWCKEQHIANPERFTAWACPVPSPGH